MGPSPVGDGEWPATDRTSLCTKCFNGAVACWRRRGVELALEEEEYKGLQWGRRLLATESPTRRASRPRRCRSFNGAVACWRRRASQFRRVEPGWVASMGPSPVGDGEDGPHDRQNDSRKRFNGAVACWRRRVSGGPSASTHYPWLQWGRRLLATERKPRPGRPG